VQQKYLIAVCDILGFSNLVENNPLDEVVGNAIGWFRKALNHSVHKNTFPNEVPPTKELDNHEHIGVAWFSDTLLIYTKADNDEAVRELLLVVGWLLFETLIQGKTKVRAGIAYGDAYIDCENSLYVGLPVIGIQARKGTAVVRRSSYSFSNCKNSRICENREIR
jgi:hypothetical protein